MIRLPICINNLLPFDLKFVNNMGGRSGQSVGGKTSYLWTTNKSENARILAGIAEKEGYKVEIQYVS